MGHGMGRLPSTISAANVGRRHHSAVSTCVIRVWQQRKIMLFPPGVPYAVRERHDLSAEWLACHSARWMLRAWMVARPVVSLQTRHLSSSHNEYSRKEGSVAVKIAGVEAKHYRQRKKDPQMARRDSIVTAEGATHHSSGTNEVGKRTRPSQVTQHRTHGSHDNTTNLLAVKIAGIEAKDYRHKRGPTQNTSRVNAKAKASMEQGRHRSAVVETGRSDPPLMVKMEAMGEKGDVEGLLGLAADKEHMLDHREMVSLLVSLAKASVDHRGGDSKTAATVTSDPRFQEAVVARLEHAVNQGSIRREDIPSLLRAFNHLGYLPEKQVMRKLVDICQGPDKTIGVLGSTQLVTIVTSLVDLKYNPGDEFLRAVVEACRGVGWTRFEPGQLVAIVHALGSYQQHERVAKDLLQAVCASLQTPTTTWSAVHVSTLAEGLVMLDARVAAKSGTGVTAGPHRTCGDIEEVVKQLVGRLESRIVAGGLSDVSLTSMTALRHRPKPVIVKSVIDRCESTGFEGLDVQSIVSTIRCLASMNSQLQGTFWMPFFRALDNSIREGGLPFKILGELVSSLSIYQVLGRQECLTLLQKVVPGICQQLDATQQRAAMTEEDKRMLRDTYTPVATARFSLPIERGQEVVVAVDAELEKVLDAMERSGVNEVLSPPPVGEARSAVIKALEAAGYNVTHTIPVHACGLYAGCLLWPRVYPAEPPPPVALQLPDRAQYWRNDKQAPLEEVRYNGRLLNLAVKRKLVSAWCWLAYAHLEQVRSHGDDAIVELVEHRLTRTGVDISMYRQQRL